MADKFSFLPLEIEEPNVGHLNSMLSDINNHLKRLDANLLQLRKDAVNTFVFAQHNGAEITQDHADGNIGTGWQPLDFYDQFTVSDRGILMDLAGNFTFVFPGIYALMLSGSVEHNELNAGREFSVRLFNTVDMVGSVGFKIGTGRNVGVTTVTLATLFEISDDNAGEIYQIEYGGTASVYSAVNWSALAFNVFSVGRFEGVFGTVGAGAARLITETGAQLITEDGAPLTTEEKAA